MTTDDDARERAIREGWHRSPDVWGSHAKWALDLADALRAERDAALADAARVGKVLEKIVSQYDRLTSLSPTTYGNKVVQWAEDALAGREGSVK